MKGANYQPICAYLVWVANYLAYVGPGVCIWGGGWKGRGEGGRERGRGEGEGGGKGREEGGREGRGGNLKSHTTL
jgi:hypothetical protein